MSASFRECSPRRGRQPSRKRAWMGEEVRLRGAARQASALDQTPPSLPAFASARRGAVAAPPFRLDPTETGA